ncbi:hypothetical protein M378DRAFT_188366 [Amanita muscaria Koide BX008]|uniref:Uncharacterized protein n=1 Tax=Amanita muscaria (strain Koide BX008) TaxID=946122 RepID=A0A0C2SUX0_AMAMK|nr:hypothetical protein M378DRAFT_188366 [Amanita muscaria Koide BX008]
MAHITRPAKSGSDWTQNDFVAYNVKVVYQNAGTFFQSPALPPLLSSPIDTHDEDVYALLRTLDLAMAPSPSRESAVDDFAVDLFRALGYTRRGRVARTRKYIPFFICGEQRRAKTDVSIVGDTNILNTTRVRTLELPLDSKIMPGIIMKEASPIFYKVHVATALTGAIALGKVETIVYAHLPSLPRPARDWSDGMKPLDNRRLLLSCYEAFRHFL